MKRLFWIGACKDDLKAFPLRARRAAGFQLWKAQQGEMPDDWKPVSVIGPGVREIRIRDAAGAFRVIYLVHDRNAVYVLHAFQKKTQKLSQHDLRLARERYKSVER
ncbi:MAG: type II toxin-antitoxin system RelE/ParE family toxin [Gammaproteobacteria bacterium]